ncbi:hypothetical protein GCM10010954_20330 [Halobacillus andaensis]|uniref:Uncharacterized protein n=1 Tax=Halobacillus andaensis TaxID=1176239 RepID=A0A917B3N5_HALAA|nr:hypothetical protein [Halobacillus andaensis]MBP2004460.1 putative membrane protein [Halobacillus andaensis]GGF21446.1 hypothetical protein GCM10010954_20330 [Halobacillus andaensis]
MRHPYEPLVRLQVASLCIAILLAIVAIFHLDNQWLILFMFYILSISLLVESLIEYKKQQLASCISQLLRAVIILLFTTILFF